MYYTRIVKYIREVSDAVEGYSGRDKVTPVVVWEAHGYSGTKELSWASLYGAHTEWIARDIDERSRVREERANAPRRRYA